MADANYRICHVTYDISTGSSKVFLEHPDYTKSVILAVLEPTDGFYYSNAPVKVSAGSNDVVLNIATDAAQLIDEEYANRQATLSADVLNSPVKPDMILIADLDDAACVELNKYDVSRDTAVIAEWNGNYYIHDPRHHVLDNTLANPLQDGGGEIARNFGSPLYAEYSTKCANVPRTFLNDESCFLLDSPTACSYRPTVAKKKFSSESDGAFLVTLDKLKAVYEATGSGAKPIRSFQ